MIAFAPSSAEVSISASVAFSVVLAAVVCSVLLSDCEVLLPQAVRATAEKQSIRAIARLRIRVVVFLIIAITFLF